MPRWSSTVFPSHQRLLEICHCDPLTGVFTRRESYHCKNVGKRMGHKATQSVHRDWLLI